MVTLMCILVVEPQGLADVSDMDVREREESRIRTRFLARVTGWTLDSIPLEYIQNLVISHWLLHSVLIQVPWNHCLSLALLQQFPNESSSFRLYRPSSNFFTAARIFTPKWKSPRVKPLFKILHHSWNKRSWSARCPSDLISCSSHLLF